MNLYDQVRIIRKGKQKMRSEVREDRKKREKKRNITLRRIAKKSLFPRDFSSPIVDFNIESEIIVYPSVIQS